jgi:PRTRC genetic system ThiF family protein
MGQFKSIVLANRYNLNLGLDWTGLPNRFPSEESAFSFANADLIISCVDVNSARVAIASYEGKLKNSVMWLDMGNAHRHGQVVFGALGKSARRQFPNVLDHYPEIAGMADSTVKSCSVAESIASQDCLINRSVATAAMTIVWELLRTGSTDRNMITVNVESGEQMTFSFPPKAS